MYLGPLGAGGFCSKKCLRASLSLLVPQLGQHSSRSLGLLACLLPTVVVDRLDSIAHDVIFTIVACKTRLCLYLLSYAAVKGLRGARIGCWALTGYSTPVITKVIFRLERDTTLIGGKPCDPVLNPLGLSVLLHHLIVVQAR